MYDSTLELAENKLLLLYIIKSIKYPISNTQLTDIVLENSFINYFMFYFTPKHIYKRFNLKFKFYFSI